MSEVRISFYLKEYRIHVHMDTLRAIDSPKRIGFLIHKDFEKFAVIPYAKHDFKSHSVPDKVYSGIMSLEISSYLLCRSLISHLNWKAGISYRVSGCVNSTGYGNKIAVFNLIDAVQI